MNEDIQYYISGIHCLEVTDSTLQNIGIWYLLVKEETLFDYHLMYNNKFLFIIEES